MGNGFSALDRATAMFNAGFPVSAIITGTAVSLTEFGPQRDPIAQAKSDVPGEESYGPWQIHLPAHPDVTKACAMDLQCSTLAAYRISNGGKNWNAWSVFTNGSYKQNLQEASVAVATVGQRAAGDPSPIFPTPSPASASAGSSVDTSSGGVSTGAPLTGLSFPSIKLGSAPLLGDFTLDTSGFFKVMITLGAMVLIFFAVMNLVGVDPVPQQLRSEKEKA